MTAAGTTSRDSDLITSHTNFTSTSDVTVTPSLLTLQVALRSAERTSGQETRLWRDFIRKGDLELLGWRSAGPCRLCAQRLHTDEDYFIRSLNTNTKIIHKPAAFSASAAALSFTSLFFFFFTFRLTDVLLFVPLTSVWLLLGAISSKKC